MENKLKEYNRLSRQLPKANKAFFEVSKEVQEHAIKDAQEQWNTKEVQNSLNGKHFFTGEIMSKLKHLTNFKFANIYCAQAFGCWLFIQIWSFGFFFGRNCKRGLRIELFKPISGGIYPKKRYNLEVRRFNND